MVSCFFLPLCVYRSVVTGFWFYCSWFLMMTFLLLLWIFSGAFFDAATWCFSLLHLLSTFFFWSIHIVLCLLQGYLLFYDFMVFCLAIGSLFLFLVRWNNSSYVLYSMKSSFILPFKKNIRWEFITTYKWKRKICWGSYMMNVVFHIT